MTGGKLSLYVHTLRHLKLQQFVWRGLNLLPKRKPQLRQTPPLRSRPAALQQDILKPDSLHLPDRFCFLNEEGSLPDIGWQGDGKSALWRYNQHYFDWLGSAAARAAPAAFAAMTEAWMAANPPAAGPGWDPYPTSLRIVNWAKAQLRGDGLSDRMLDSLACRRSTSAARSNGI